MVVNINNQPNQASSFSNNSRKNFEQGVLCSFVLAGAGLALYPVERARSKKMRSYSNGLTENEIKNIKINAQNILEKTGLKAKGVKIEWFNDNELKKTKEIANEIKINSFKSLKEKLNLLSNSKVHGSFWRSANKVKMYGKGSILSVFHELGHAMNSNSGKISKIAKKLTCSWYLSLPIALYIALKSSRPKKPDENKKSKDFIENNAGKITFTTFLPILVEEGSASFRGWKEAKKVLSPDIYKKVVKQGSFGFISYLAPAIFASLGIYAISKIKKEDIEKVLNKTKKILGINLNKN